MFKKVQTQLSGQPFHYSFVPATTFLLRTVKSLRSAPYAQYFTGNSYLAQLGGGFANVTFVPGCRNNWHIHHGAVQVLICVAGRGWYQEWGKPAVPMTPGSVIEIPAGVKRWHGTSWRIASPTET